MPGRGAEVRPGHLGAAHGGRGLLLPPHQGELGDGRPVRELRLHQGVGQADRVAEERPLDADQLAYLKGSTAVYDALWENQPEGEVEDDLPGYKAQAKAVAAALDTHVQALRNIEQPETGKLRAQLEKAAGEWKKAASAGDSDTFYLAYDGAFTGIDPNKSIAARKELKLATTVPADEAEVWAG